MNYFTEYRWRNSSLKRIFKRHYDMALLNGISTKDLEELTLSKVNKSLSKTKIAEIAYTRGILKTIIEMDGFNSKISLQSGEQNQAVLQEASTKGNVCRFEWFDHITKTSFFTYLNFEFNGIAIEAENVIDCNISHSKNKPCLFFIPEKNIPCSWGISNKMDYLDRLEDFIFGDGVVCFSEGMTYNNYLKTISNITPLIAENIVPDNIEDLEVIDFGRNGNQIVLYLGTQRERMPYGDDWDDILYDCNSRPVFEEYVKAIVKFSIPFDFYVFDPTDNAPNCRFSKKDMQKRMTPCLIISTEETKSAVAANIKNPKNVFIYFGDNAGNVVKALDDLIFQWRY